MPHVPLTITQIKRLRSMLAGIDYAVAEIRSELDVAEGGRVTRRTKSHWKAAHEIVVYVEGVLVKSGNRRPTRAQIFEKATELQAAGDPKVRLPKNATATLLAQYDANHRRAMGMPAHRDQQMKKPRRW